MKKIFVAIACMVTALCTYIIVANSSSIWEMVDSQLVKGGTCYQYAEVLQCQGGDASCGTTICTNFNCPVASQPMTLKLEEFWYPSVKDAETGRVTHTPKTTKCAVTQTCYSTCQYDDSGTLYCVIESEVPDDKSGVKLEGNSCP
jgi:hypothetical protein